MKSLENTEGLVTQTKGGIWLIAYFEGSKKNIENHCKKNKVKLQDVFHIAVFSKQKKPKLKTQNSKLRTNS